MKEETGSPGVCVAVSIDGKTVWSEGFGFADVENRVLCSSKTVMRIASISKPLTATAAAKLWEEGKLDLDVPIQKYVASFPEKTFRGTPVTITTRHLLSHLGGIRDYNKNKSSNEESKTENQSKNSNALKEQVMASTDTSQSGTVRKSCTCTQQSDSREEFYIKDHYDTVTEAISIFKDDPLLSDPGTSYLYTTYGWTLLSAVIEGASSQDFLSFMKKLFKELGMENTHAEFNDRIIYNRARFYQRNSKGHLVNAPYVDNSLKWGGGGFMSNVEDLVQFGNSMLYAKQMSCVNKENFGTTGYLPGFLRPETVTELWKIVTNTEGKGHKDGGYGLGWVVIPKKQDFGSCYHQSETVFHTGGAVGASSILLIRPHHVYNKPPKGVVVVLLVNLQRVDLEKTAMDVAACFEKTKL
ncbi:serine beta-lactamase-like protein LACTB, mitochondrial [Orbicella faveolata]|uniref:serine beta-lactamase-like protein LACTB, mitochondrial n=1 Tax=Orbicella faveolata TaxID=48498 RepID=UPI0009E33ACB|nr:serine beta-lactamase-like protein LACTB, mitochondrial [Orbicella faveolata]